MFESTLSVGGPTAPRPSTWLRGLPPSTPARGHGPSGFSSLPPSVLDDLRRFDRDGVQTELLEVIAASLRHHRNLLVLLEYGKRSLPLTIFPAQRLVHCPLPPVQLLTLRLHELFVLGVEPALLEAPQEHDLSWHNPEDAERFGSLDLLAWELAMRGARSALLPEISPLAAFRIPPGVSVQGLDLHGNLAGALHRLKRQASNLRDIAGWSGFDRERATRFLNALYLQSALMATRTHPLAGDGWA
jgi:hypothetical protein